MNKRVISDYLESLKEDDELDYIFPLLLESMGFQIVSTPKNSKGQPQYRKDVVAIGDDENGIRHKWYFELKGNAAKDITDRNFNIQDGVRESILAAKDVDYKDASIPGFDLLPRKVVFVHNGILKENTKAQFDGLISREFSNGEFERWGIEKLTDLFYKYLFDECLYRDDECHKLVKKILVQHDAPGWTTRDFDRLVNIILENCSKNLKHQRKVIQGLSAINLMLAIMFKEGKDQNFLLSSKKSSDRAVLMTWEWILRNNLEKDKTTINLFCKIVNLHITIYLDTVKKLMPLASQYKGLYMVNGLDTEGVFYPLRCYDFIGTLLYFAEAQSILITDTDSLSKHHKFYCDRIIDVVKNNSGFDMPLLDTHSIPLIGVIRYLLSGENYEDYLPEISAWIVRIVTNIILRKRDNGMLPELYGNRKSLAESIFKKSSSYCDSSSLFLLNLFEIIAALGFSELYTQLRKVVIENDVDLQVSYPIKNEDLEYNLFNHRLHQEMAVESSIQLPETIEEFKDTFVKNYNHIDLRTEKTPFSFLITLAHIHYQTDWFPDFIDFGFLHPLKNS